MRLQRLIYSSLYLIFSFIILFPRIVTADILDNWHWRNPLPQGNNLIEVAYGNGTFVAVGESGRILTSSDGISWTDRGSGGAASLSRVTYGNGIFVAVGNSSTTGYDGTILTSSDGINWTERRSYTESGVIEKLRDVAYGNGTFVVVGDDAGWPTGFTRNSIVLTSSDGISWIERLPHPLGPFILAGVTYGNGTFVLVGQHGAIASSPDGITWTERQPGTSVYLSGVTYGNGSFVVVGEGGAILQSDSLFDNPPSKPELLYPTNDLTLLQTPITFRWKKSVDPDGDAVTYDLYVCENQSFTGCYPARLSSVDTKSSSAASIVGYAAGLFVIGLIVSDGLSRRRKILLLLAVVLVFGMLFVSCGGGGAPSPVIKDEVTYTMPGLNAGTTYYWKVVADDGKGGRTESAVWHFTTR